MPSIEQLLQFYKDDPDDPFNSYALALAYLKADHTQAKRYFDILLDKHSEYLPTYYHAAALYQNLGMKEKASAIYEKGIVVARKQGDEKAARELKSAWDELMFE